MFVTKLKSAASLMLTLFVAGMCALSARTGPVSEAFAPTPSAHAQPASAAPPARPDALAQAERAIKWRLTKEDAGKLPIGWKSAQTGKGKGSVWKVVADESAPSKSGYVLAQTAEGPGKLFNLCVAEESKYKDVEIQVAFKALRGKEDQGGGIMWRYRDANNYYVARMNPLESNYRVYKVVAGKRSQLGTKEDLKIPVGEWHNLKIKQKGEQIECWLDGKKYLEVKDATYTKAGKIGLWTKADAQTAFDDLRVRGD